MRIAYAAAESEVPLSEDEVKKFEFLSFRTPGYLPRHPNNKKKSRDSYALPRCACHVVMVPADTYGQPEGNQSTVAGTPRILILCSAGALVPATGCMIASSETRCLKRAAITHGCGAAWGTSGGLSGSMALRWTASFLIMAMASRLCLFST